MGPRFRGHHAPPVGVLGRRGQRSGGRIESPVTRRVGLLYVDGVQADMSEERRQGDTS